jgi:hypothetical protein
VPALRAPSTSAGQREPAPGETGRLHLDEYPPRVPGAGRHRPGGSSGPGGTTGRADDDARTDRDGERDDR